MAVPFGGVGVALVTLFDESGSLLLEATAEHASRLAALGVRLLLVCGSTGEASALTPDERTALIDAVRAAVPLTVPVLAGTGANTVRAAEALTREAREAGADAILALSPPGSEGLVHYYTAVGAAAGDLPVLAYHFPTMSAPGIPVEVLSQLPIGGLKDSSGDPDRLVAEVSAWDGSVFVGSTRTLELARSVGAAGAILGIANAEPELCVAAFDGDASAQRALAVAREREAIGSFPHGIKHMTSERFGVSAVVRRDTIVSVGRRKGSTRHA